MHKKLTIKAKVIVLIVVSLSLLTIILAGFSVTKAKEGLINQSYSMLTATRDSKSNQIQKFFDERIGDIKVLANSSDVKKLYHSLEQTFSTVGLNSGSNYDVSSSEVQTATKPFENFFQNYNKEYGYYDVFLITPDTGHVIYTATKESDYGANLKSGSLKDSGLGEVWRKTLQNDKVTYVDMRPYAPSNNAPAMFIGNPVYENGNIKAILVFQISDRAINKIMQFRKGYGDSQEDYLVGSDMLMRSDSYLDPEGHSLKASFSNNTKVDTKATKEALAGKKNTEVIIDYNGNPVLSAYAPLNISENLKWAIISEIDEAEVLKTPNAIRDLILIIAVVLLALVVIGAIIIINNVVVKRLERFQKGLEGFFKYINRESKEVVELESDSFDEIGLMAKVVNENIQKAKKSIDEDRDIIEETISVLNEFEQGDLRQRINTSVDNPALNKLKDVLNQMADNLEDNIDSILDVLEQYSKYNYVPRVKTDGLKEHLLKLSNGVNSLGNATTQMLIDNKKSGLIMDGSSDVLLANVETLNQASNEAAASLEETAAALEEITGNVTSTTHKISEMSNLANQVTNSASEGQSLATKTTDAMDEINTQVTSINEAITIIDQIAFQTNILSLNAAVEAATAGEAGKGFAVVAQEVRNLANRSADAASEIKTLVENANVKANEGKNIADEMIKGYSGLNSNIDKTIELISDVSSASKEQETGIVQINDAINSLDQQTQKNASVASETRNIALSTSELAKDIVSKANEKEFEGKNSIDVTKEVEDLKINNQSSYTQMTNEKKTTTNYSSKPKNSYKSNTQNTSIKDNSSSDEEWETF